MLTVEVPRPPGPPFVNVTWSLSLPSPLSLLVRTFNIFRVNLLTDQTDIVSRWTYARKCSCRYADASLPDLSPCPVPAGRLRHCPQASLLALSVEGKCWHNLTIRFKSTPPGVVPFLAYLILCRVFGFLSGAVVAGASVYYYILGDYRVANEMLTDDISVCLKPVLWMSSHASFSLRLTAMCSPRVWG